MPITEKDIRMLYLKVLNDIDKNILATEKWVHPPTELEFIQEMNCLGKAHSSGTIKISRYFIGTEGYTELNNTLRHEFAHLAAGCKNGHKRMWKTIAAKFKADPSRLSNNCTEFRKGVMKESKYTLIITYVDGEIEKHPAGRKIKSRVDHKYKSGTWRGNWYRNSDKKIIDHFEYIKNLKGEN